MGVERGGRPGRAGIASSLVQGSPKRNTPMARVNAGGDIFISHSVLNGRYVLRLAVGHMRTTEEDVRCAWEVLRREAAAR